MQKEDDLNPRWHRGTTGFRELEIAWHGLSDRVAVPSFSQRPDWYAARAVAMPALMRQMVFIAVRTGNKLVAVLPFRTRRMRVCGLPLSVLEVYDPHELASLDAAVDREVDCQALRSALVAFLTSQTALPWQVMFCRKVLGESHVATLIDAATELAPIREEVGGCDMIAVRPDQDILQALPRKTRHNLRNRRRKLDGLGEAEFVTSSALPELADAFEAFLSVEASGWKGRDGTAIRLIPEVRSFFDDVMRRFASREACDIHLLQVDGKPLAAQFCLRTGETAHILKIGYDESFAQIAPGNLLLEYALRQYAQRGDVRFVNLMDDEPWMRQWDPIRKPVVNVFAFNPHAAPARIARLVFRAMKQCRPFYRRYVKPLMRRKQYA